MKFSAFNVDFSNPSPDPLGSRIPAHAGVKKGYPSKCGYLSAAGLSNVKMVADMHRHAAQHNKHWQRASWECLTLLTLIDLEP